MKPLIPLSRAATAAIVTHLLWGSVEKSVGWHLLRGLVLGAGGRVSGVLGLGLGLGRCGGSLTRRLGLGGGPEGL